MRVHEKFFADFKAQVREHVANDNMSVRDAQSMRRWAEERAHDPGFAPFCAVAAARAQAVVRDARPRSV